MVTKEQIKKVRAALDAALAGIGVEGVKLSVGRGQYGGAEGWLKIIVATLDESGRPVSKQREYMMARGPTWIWGDGIGDWELKGSDLDRRFKDSRGRIHRVDGFNIRSPKRPVCTICEADGKEYRWPIRSVWALLKTSEVK